MAVVCICVLSLCSLSNQTWAQKEILSAPSRYTLRTNLWNPKNSEQINTSNEHSNKSKKEMSPARIELAAFGLHTTESVHKCL
jgi:hypothetical protein